MPMSPLLRPRKRKRDKYARLRLRIAVDHPGWTAARVNAEIVRAVLGQGDYARAPELP